METCKKRYRQLNNKGFSLVELLVTVAIMAVLIGAVTISYYMVNKTNVKKAINYINDALSLCREKAMTNAADEWDVIIRKDSKGDQYVDVVKIVAKEEIKEGESEPSMSLEKIEVSSESLPSNVSLDLEVDDKIYAIDASHSTAISYKANGEVGIVRYHDNSFNMNDNPEVDGDTSVLYSSKKIPTKSYLYVNGSYSGSKKGRVVVYYATGKHKAEDL